MRGGKELVRTCPFCSNEYKASRPACPRCGKPPFSRRTAYATQGPRLLILLAFFFFLVWAAYGFLYPPQAYEKHRALFFGVNQTASRILGSAGAVLFLALTVFVFRRKR
ncbi:MAG: hypothetical protein ACYTHM_10235 [Planctomycetota bacterium]|jgi:hypothetical protein